jgi:murein DD-endopeptidase MepM/ murein hydrolase activator NlpD
MSLLIDLDDHQIKKKLAELPPTPGYGVLIDMVDSTGLKSAAHSMLVKIGDHVRQSQTLGKLGHSGDTSGPHCHYQLQAGPDWENADALPCKFSNVDEPFLDRGTYFEAK